MQAGTELQDLSLKILPPNTEPWNQGRQQLCLQELKLDKWSSQAFIVLPYCCSPLSYSWDLIFFFLYVSSGSKNSPMQKNLWISILSLLYALLVHLFTMRRSVISIPFWGAFGCQNQTPFARFCRVWNAFRTNISLFKQYLRHTQMREKEKKKTG